MSPIILPFTTQPPLSLPFGGTNKQEEGRKIGVRKER
jgi:hypothetical protein